MEHYYNEEEQEEMEALALQAEQQRQDEEDFNRYLQEQIDKELSDFLLKDDMISTDDIFFPSSEEELWRDVQNNENITKFDLDNGNY